MFLAGLWKQVFINRIDKEDVASMYVNTHTHKHTHTHTHTQWHITQP